MRQYFHNLLVALNRVLGAVLFGEPDMTISAQCYVAQISIYERYAVRVRALRALGRVLDHFWPGHCARAGANAKVRAEEVLNHLPVY